MQDLLHFDAHLGDALAATNPHLSGDPLRGQRDGEDGTARALRWWEVGFFGASNCVFSK